MDPLSAFSLAINIIQIVDFSYKLVVGTSERELVEHSELKSITEHLSKQLSDLDTVLKAKKPQKSLSEHEKNLMQLGQECNGVVAELLAALEKVRVEGTHKRWNSCRQALLTIWHRDSIDTLEKRLRRFREQMVINTLSTLRDGMETANQQQNYVLEHVSDIKEDTQSIGQNFLAHIEDSSQWHRDLIDAIRRSQPFGGVSGPNRKFEVSDIQNQILYKLHFEDIEDRHDRITEAHRQTFKWIYCDPEIKDRRWTSFVNWLEKDHGIYWIAGKPGSGKSTLMKYIHGNPATIQHLKEWASPHSLATAAFFFWNSGSKMQMSQTGLLQTLLFKALSKHPSLIPKVFPERWEVCSLFGEDTRGWGWSELTKAIELLVNEQSVALKFCFFIDGLDEFDGDHQELVELLYTISTSSNVKICAASRPWPIFEDAFKSKPSLLLQDLTHPDIQLFVEAKFRDHVGFMELEQREPEFAARLLEDIATKSSGVFLWIYLVVDSLLTGLTNGDRISDLQRRLDSLPPDLGDLFQKILDSIDPFYREQASQIFQFVRAAVAPLTILSLSLADEENSEVIFPVRPMSGVAKVARAKNMKRRLGSRCKGLLEIAPLPGSRLQLEDYNPSLISHHLGVTESSTKGAVLASEVPDSLNVTNLMKMLKVQYLHRTVKDFLEVPKVWNGITTVTEPSFNPFRSLCRSFIIQLRTSCPDSLTIEEFWDLVTWSLQYAALIEKQTGQPDIQLLDELDQTATALTSCPTSRGDTLLEHHARLKGLSNCSHWTKVRLPWISGSSFLHLIALCGLDKYLRTKLEQGCIPIRSPLENIVTPLLDPVVTDYVTFLDYKEKPHFSTPILPFETIKLLLEKGNNPNHSFRGRTPWQNLLSESNPEGHGPLAEWLKVVEVFVIHGADLRMTNYTPVWEALQRFFPVEMLELETMAVKRTVASPTRAKVQRLGQWITSLNQKNRTSGYKA